MLLCTSRPPPLKPTLAILSRRPEVLTKKNDGSAGS
jgi:hypothetical protein